MADPWCSNCARGRDADCPTHRPERRCEECGDRRRPRGKWSPYFCEPCDLERMKRLDGQFAEIAKQAGLPFERGFAVEES